jgi:flagellar protein FliO/FliZ
MDLVLLLRVALTLACVLGLLWFVARRAQGGRSGAALRRRAPALTVLGRQSLGGRTAVALVEVAGRRLVLGVCEHGVALLAEVDPEPDPVENGRTALDTDALERLLALGEPEPVGVDRPSSTVRVTGLPATDCSKVDSPTVDRTTAGRTTTAPSGGRAAASSSRVPEVVPTVPAPSSPAVRMTAVPMPRTPLEGSILDAATWRRAVAAVQERTLRH